MKGRVAPTLLPPLAPCPCPCPCPCPGPGPDPSPGPSFLPLILILPSSDADTTREEVPVEALRTEAMETEELRWGGRAPRPGPDPELAEGCLALARLAPFAAAAAAAAAASAAATAAAAAEEEEEEEPLFAPAPGEASLLPTLGLREFREGGLCEKERGERVRKRDGRRGGHRKASREKQQSKAPLSQITHAPPVCRVRAREPRHR